MVKLVDVIGIRIGIGGIIIFWEDGLWCGRIGMRTDSVWWCGLRPGGWDVQFWSVGGQVNGVEWSGHGGGDGDGDGGVGNLVMAERDFGVEVDGDRQGA